MAGQFSGMTRRNIEKSAFIERLPFAKFGVAGGWLLQKSQIIEVFLFGKNSVNSGKLRNVNPAVENRARRMFATAENKKLQIPL